MRQSALGTLYRFELKMLLRDKRTILLSIVLPVLVMPLILFSSSLVERAREKRQEKETYRYAVTGSEAARARELIAGWKPDANDDGPRLTLEEVSAADPAAEFEAEEIHFYLEALPPGTPSTEEEVGDEPAEARTDEVREAEAATKEDLELPLLRLVFRANWDASDTASREMRERLEKMRREARYAELTARGLPVAAADVAAVEERDLASDTQVTGAAVGRFAAVFVLLFLLTGGSVVAADAIAGEKERGTLETVLTTAVSRRELVTAKLLVTLTVGVMIAVLLILDLFVCVGLEVIEVPESFAVDLSAGTVALLLVLLLPLAALAGFLLLLVSGIAKTYKEFQLYFFPVFLLLLVPATASMLPGIELRSAVVLVPVANLAVAMREVLVGRFDGLFLALAWAVSMAAAWAAGRATLKTLSTERLITASEIDRAEFEGGAALLPRHVWRWYTAMWVLILLASLNFEGMQALRPQLVFNLIVVFLGGSLLIVRVYRLPLREALALRPVKPVVWLSVLLGAPSFYLTAIVIGRLSAYLFPLPERALEELTRGILPPDLPLWELVVLVAVLPGICEELCFRGVFLYSLRRRFHPAVLCVVVGAVFALFHMTLVRLLPTAVLGVLLAAVTLLTGSIFPAMLWHALNNATAIVASRQEVAVMELEWWVYAAGTAAAALALALIWRHRTPYPGLRQRYGGADRRSASSSSGGA